MPSLSIVVAVDKNNGIGRNGDLPWPKLEDDLQYFNSITTNTLNKKKKNAVIMGRTTWFSIPEKFRPLPNRLNVVLSSTIDELEGVLVFKTLQDAIDNLNNDLSIENIYIVGGSKVYEEAINHPDCVRIFKTQIFSSFECDTYFPSIPPHLYTKYVNYNQRKEYISNNIKYIFECYDRKENEEYQYLDLVREIIENGTVKDDRTGTGVRASFGHQMRFSLRDNQFPLLTTKRVFWKGVAKELLWFVKGSTNAKQLSDEGVHIWDENGKRSFLDSRGLSHREENDLGPVYGFQWRHWGAGYSDFNADYTGKGIDQLQQCIDTIKNNPTDRRIILTAWNPSELDNMALPPCHMMCQFFVSNGELSCQMYQRSCDMGLGVPFNIASYALLTCMIAKICNLKPGEFIHVLGDAHVYSNHIEALKIQLERKPRSFPKLFIHSNPESIDGFKFEDFEISGYNPHDTVKMKMAV